MDPGCLPEDLGPIGAWSSCDGTITLAEGNYTWQNLDGSCTITGPSSFGENILIFTEIELTRCEDPPWWIEVFEGGSAQFSPNVADSRLTLIPIGDFPSGQVAQFEEALDYERWELTTPEGYINNARLCFVEGQFFGGRYTNIDGSCEFLSCTGIIENQIIGSDTERWTTECGGDCPCGGVITLDSRTEDSISGEYYGHNCARTLEGTFTGSPL